MTSITIESASKATQSTEVLSLQRTNKGAGKGTATIGGNATELARVGLTFRVANEAITTFKQLFGLLATDMNTSNI